MVIASNDLPDTFAVDATMYDQLVKAGKLEDLSDAYEKYASPALKDIYAADKGQILDSIKYGGKMYGLPFGNDIKEGLPVLWLRTDWLKKLGLSEPKNMDDVINIAKAFTENDPDGNGKKDTYGLAFSNSLFSWDLDISGFFYGYHAYPIEKNGNIFWLKDQSGNIVPGVVQEENKTALGKLKELYDAGCIDKEFAVKDSNKVIEDIAQNKFGMMYGGVWGAVWSLKTLKEANPDSDWEALPIPSIDGKPGEAPALYTWLVNIFVVKKGYAHPEALVKAANLVPVLCFDPDSHPEIYRQTAKNERLWRCTIAWPAATNNSYPMYQHFNKALETGDESVITKEDDTAGDWQNAKKFKAGETTNSLYWGSYRTWGPAPSSYSVVDYYLKNNLIKSSEYYGPPTPTMTEASSNLISKFNEIATKIIMGSDVSEFDQFIDYWHNQGGDAITKEVNDWYKAK